MLPTDWLDLPLSTIAQIAPLQELSLDEVRRRKLRLFVKREDLLHPYIGGNKLYKLHTHLSAVRANKSALPIVSFGGAYSNHLFALAAAGQMCGLQTIGVVRGEKPKVLSATLQDALTMGMQLHFVSRERYREKHLQSFKEALRTQFGDFHYIPEGGAGIEGARGSAAMAKGIMSQLDRPPSAVFHACGTGASLAGLAYGFDSLTLGASQTVECIGVPVLKNLSSLKSDIGKALITLGANKPSWQLCDDYHFGGYAKFPAELKDFMTEFEDDANASLGENEKILLDPVYTSKMFYAVLDLIKQDYFPAGAHIVVVHSGGLQGRRGFGLDFPVNTNACNTKMTPTL